MCLSLVHPLPPLTSNGATGSKGNEISGTVSQSNSFSNSRHVSGIQLSKSSKPKPNHMENMSVEHLKYLEQRLQQLLELMPSRPGKLKLICNYIAFLSL